jgi:hypothetical protein
MACDICGKTGTQLYTLLSSYQTEDIKAVCPDCDKILTRKKSKVMSMLANMQAALLKRFMYETKAAKALK